jgi:hypothetical protein
MFSDDLIFEVVEGTEFQQLFTEAYCLSRHVENYLFYPLKLLMSPQNVLPPCVSLRTTENIFRLFGGFLPDYTASHSM